MKVPFAKFWTLQIYARIIGWNATFRVRLHDLMLRRLNLQPAFEIQLELKNACHPLKMRTGKNSDRVVLDQIFIHPQHEPIALVTQPTSSISGPMWDIRVHTSSPGTPSR
jgi:hypothetical protein